MSIRNNRWFNQLIKEWLLLASGVGLVSTSIYLNRLPLYTFRDFEILFILLTLFIIIKGLENAKLFAVAASLIEKGRIISLKLIVATALLSMIVTNDVALLIIVPLTLRLHITRKDVLIIMETLAANAGSALTPFGNPQNLFIYWFYHLHPLEFFATIAPLTVTFILLLAATSFFLKTRNQTTKVPEIKISRRTLIYLVFLVIFILAILKILPLWIGFIMIGYVLFGDRQSLRIDYLLLLTFFCFFGFTDNLMAILTIRLEKADQVFLLSALLSQFISNVPTALLFSDFTNNWQALLWGVNVGGFGNLIGSLASLIAYRLYVNHEHKEKYFLIKFHALGYLAFGLGCVIYFVLML